jgi:hypothetical protein
VRDSSTLSCERTSSCFVTQESRRTSVPYVSHDLVRRLSTPHHSASLISGLFRHPFRVMAVSAIRDAIQLHLQVFPRNRPAFRLTPISMVTLFRQLYRETRPILRVNISLSNPVTARISKKTIIKLLMPFFPSYIMDLGTLAPAARLYLPFAAPRIFDNCISRYHPAGRRSHAGWRGPMACDP